MTPTDNDSSNMQTPTDNPEKLAHGALPVILVTGMSGAGNSTAIRVLEDAGFEAIDNLPMGFLRLMMDSSAPLSETLPDLVDDTPVAIGIDSRTRDFSPEKLLDYLNRMKDAHNSAVLLLFLDCQDNQLVDRFKSTRRRHPMAPAESPAAGIERERELMYPLREQADLVIDTSQLSPHDLKARLTETLLARLVNDPKPTGLSIAIQSFSYKTGAPREADSLIDCRFLSNPYWNRELRALDGRTSAVQKYVKSDPLYADFMSSVHNLTRMLIPAYAKEGKAYYCIGFGCSGGHHRSVTAAEDLAARLSADGWQVDLRHRELADAPERRGGNRQDNGGIQPV